MLSYSKLLARKESATIHDLRRTAATLLAGLGTSREVLRLILNHVDRDVTARYDRHRYEAGKREAMQRLDDLLLGEESWSEEQRANS